VRSRLLELARTLLGIRDSMLRREREDLAGHPPSTRPTTSAPATCSTTSRCASATCASSMLRSLRLARHAAAFTPRGS
jgi:hypothetical protein